MKKLLTNIFAIALALSLAVGQAHATAWTMPSANAPGPSGGTKTLPPSLINGGLSVVGSTLQSKIGTPAAPTVVQNGTTGATSLVYACTAFDSNGNQTVPSATTTITNGNATLSATNYVRVTCGGKVGAVGYLIHKADTAHVIGYCPAAPNGGNCTFIDSNTTGIVNSGGDISYTYTANTVDQTAGMSCAGQVVVSAGSAEVTAPCMSNYTSCGVSIGNVGVTPTVGYLASCFPTSTATVINLVTVTVGAAQIFTDSTPATSPVINWWGSH